MTEDFGHLFASSRPIAALSSAERLRRIRSDRWINYPRAQQALAMLEDLIAFPQRARMPNLLIVGASGMGKTMIVEKFARDHPAHFDAVNGLKRMPVVVVQMVSGPDEARFYKRLLAAIGAPEPPRPTLGALESVALRVLEEARPGMLVIDEVHSLQAGTVREQARFLNMLRFLGNELRIPLVCVGTQQARNALRTDDQLVRRFEAIALPPWQNDQDFAALIGSLQRTLPLRRESEIGERALKRILEATGGVTAAIFSLMTRLAVAAVVSGEERIMGCDVEDAKATLSLSGRGGLNAAALALLLPVAPRPAADERLSSWLSRISAGLWNCRRARSWPNSGSCESLGADARKGDFGRAGGLDRRAHRAERGRDRGDDVLDAWRRALIS